MRNWRFGAWVIAGVLVLGCGVLPGEESGDSSPPGSVQPSPSVTDEFNSDVSGAIGTAEEYWGERFRADGLAFEPVKRIIPYRSNQAVRCGGQTIGPNNAAYCTAGDFIAFDQDWMREYFASIGDAFVYYALGHEYAHAIQFRLELPFQLSVERELNADCLAGAYIGDSVKADRLLLEEGDVEELQNGLVAVADPTDNWFAENAHGTAEQRVSAFAEGYKGSVDACLGR
jgi:hypothetical protein